MNITEVVKKLEKIEKEQSKIENKYCLTNKGMRPKWTKKDTARFDALRKEQKKLVGLGHGDVLSIYGLVKLIVKILKIMK